MTLLKFAEADRVRAVQAITMLAEAFRQPISAATIAAYEAGLCDLPIASVERACLAAIRSCKFMPSVAELRDIEHQTRRGQDGKTRPSDPKRAAEQAWCALSHARNNYWWSKTVTFADVAINAVVRATGGWQWILEMPNTQFNLWYKKEFITSYLARFNLPLEPDACAPLVSEHASDSEVVVRINTDLSVVEEKKDTESKTIEHSPTCLQVSTDSAVEEGAEQEK